MQKYWFANNGVLGHKWAVSFYLSDYRLVVIILFLLNMTFASFTPHVGITTVGQASIEDAMVMRIKWIETPQIE